MFVAKAERHLTDQIETQGVSQFIESRLTGIVAQAHIVDGSLLHHVHILQREVIGNHLHSIRVCRMGVNSAQFNGLTVKFEDISLN